MTVPRPRPAADDTTGPCPGPCNRRWRLADVDLVPGQPVWCGRCVPKIHDALACLPDLLAMLHADAYHATRAPGDGRGSHDGSPSPAPALDELDEVVRVLQGWEDAYRSAKGWPAAQRPAGVATLLDTHRWLLAHVDVACQHPDLGADLGLELLALARRLSGAVCAEPRRRRMPEPCPACSQRTLVHVAGDAWVRCDDDECARVLSWAEWEHLAAGAAVSA